MNKNNHRLQELLRLYTQQSISDIEKAELWDYVNDPLYQSEIQNLLSAAFDEQTDQIELSENIQQQVLSFIFKQDTAKPKMQVQRLWPRFTVAASIVLAVCVAGYFYFNNKPIAKPTIVHSKRKVPIRNSATLTLADGKEITLSDAGNGELAKEYGVSISKTADGKLVYEIQETKGNAVSINTLSTARGETYDVILPDGTNVTLNAASTLKYPSNFTALTKRKVELNGEAYFEVAKDKKRPFIVQTDNQEVEVLGTHFNISAYTGEIIKTTLFEGAVKIAPVLASGKIGNYASLTPGQMAVNDKEKINVTTLDNVENEMAWKNGYFVFNGKSLIEVMNDVSRWYDVEVEYQGDVSTVKLGGSISRAKSIEQLLAKIEITGSVHFKIDGRRVIVKI